MNFRRVVLAGALSLALACDGSSDTESTPDAGAPADGGRDAGAAGPSIPWLGADGTVRLDPLAPCPDGWRAAITDTGVGICEPYGDTGRATCPAGQAHFPGEEGCVPVGSACPSGDFPDDLPTVGVSYVLAGATGGDGTRALPFGTITEALSVASPGTTIAVGPGRYAEVLTMPAMVALRGACAAETIITGSPSDPRLAMINVSGAGVVIRDIQVGPTNRNGIAVTGVGSAAELTGVIVEGATLGAITVLASSQLRASTLVVRGTRAASTGAGGRGLVLENGVAEIERALFENNREASLFVGLRSASLTARDVWVADTESSTASGLFGRGLNLQDGGQAALTRVVFERSHDAGIFMAGSGTTLDATDVIVRDTRGRAADGTGGRGINVQLGASVTATRLLVERSSELGLMVAAPGTTVVLDGVVVRDTAGHPAGDSLGRAINVMEGAQLTMTRAIVERSREAGIVTDGWDTVSTLTDVVVRDTREQMSDGAGGRGISVQYGATVEMERALLERSMEVGLFVYEEGATARLSSAIIRDTASDSFGMSGHGMGAYLSGRIVASDFLVTASALAGLQLARGGVADLQDGEVSRNVIGANVQTPDFDLGRLQVRVRYVDNETSLDAAELPVPEPSVPARDL